MKSHETLLPNLTLKGYGNWECLEDIGVNFYVLLWFITYYLALIITVF